MVCVASGVVAGSVSVVVIVTVRGSSVVVIWTSG